MGMGRGPGFAEFGAAGGFFRGDAEMFADACADFLQSPRQGAEVIAGAAVVVVVGDAEGDVFWGEF